MLNIRQSRDFNSGNGFPLDPERYPEGAGTSDPVMRSRKSLILAAAFGTLVLVIALSGAAAWRKGTQLMHQVASVHATHKTAGDALQTIRENVYLMSVLTRDYLMDPDPLNAQEYIDQYRNDSQSKQISGISISCHRPRYVSAAAVERLRKELEDHWDPAEIVLDLSPEQRVLRRAQLLRRGVSRRQEIFELAAAGPAALLDANLGTRTGPLTRC